MVIGMVVDMVSSSPRSWSSAWSSTWCRRRQGHGRRHGQRPNPSPPTISLRHFSASTTLYISILDYPSFHHHPTLTCLLLLPSTPIPVPHLASISVFTLLLISLSESSPSFLCFPVPFSFPYLSLCSSLLRLCSPPLLFSLPPFVCHYFLSYPSYCGKFFNP
jgi:hypothetical protein